MVEDHQIKEMGKRDLGRHIGLEEFKRMSEKEQYAHVFVAIKAITHLEIAAKESDTLLERSRSIFGAYNLKKNLDVARRIYNDLH